MVVGVGVGFLCSVGCGCLAVFRRGVVVVVWADDKCQTRRERQCRRDGSMGQSVI